MKLEKLITVAASLTLASSIASGTILAKPVATSELQMSSMSSHAKRTLIARETEPGDDHGKDRRPKKPHKPFIADQNLARENEPGDDRGKDKHDRKPFITGQDQIARESEPRDDHGKDRRPKRPMQPRVVVYLSAVNA